MSTGSHGAKLTHKETALSFLHLVTLGQIREAYEKLVGPSFRHHNAYFKGDAASLRAGMEENHAKFPNKALKVQHAVEDGDLVAVHSHVTLQPGQAGLALVHIFRFENGKIVELWDMGQPVPESSVNENGMF